MYLMISPNSRNDAVKISDLINVLNDTYKVYGDVDVMYESEDGITEAMHVEIFIDKYAAEPSPVAVIS